MKNTEWIYNVPEEDEDQINDPAQPEKPVKK